MCVCALPVCVLVWAFGSSYPPHRNLSVLWWKAIAGNCLFSKGHDGGVAHDMLPSFTRSLVRFPLSYLYPLLHHQNVAMRTVFLDEVSAQGGGSASVAIVTYHSGGGVGRVCALRRGDTHRPPAQARATPAPLAHGPTHSKWRTSSTTCKVPAAP